MVPDDSALVPALRCSNPRCNRIIPRTSVSYRGKGSKKAQLNRAVRAHTRRQIQQKRLDEVVADALVEHCKEN